MTQPSIDWPEVDRLLDRRLSYQTMRRAMRRTLLGIVDSLAAGHITPTQAALHVIGGRAAVTLAQYKSDDRQRVTEISRLKQIKGIGPVLAARLLDEFGTYNRIASASYDELMNVKGMKKSTAVQIRKYMKSHS